MAAWSLRSRYVLNADGHCILVLDVALHSVMHCDADRTFPLFFEDLIFENL